MYQLKLSSSQVEQCSQELRNGYNFTISYFNNNYYVNKIHLCGAPEAIAAGTYSYCCDLISQIKGQQTLFDF